MRCASGPEVADRAAAALEEAGSAAVSGEYTMAGETGEIDLQVQGEDLAGTLSVGGLDVQLTAVGGQVHMQAPGDFWAQSACRRSLWASWTAGGCSSRPRPPRASRT